MTCSLRLHSETQDPQQIAKNGRLPGRAEVCRENVRRAYVQTGKVIDPQSGRELPLSEKHRFGII